MEVTSERPRTLCLPRCHKCDGRGVLRVDSPSRPTPESVDSETPAGSSPVPVPSPGTHRTTSTLNASRVGSEAEE